MTNETEIAEEVQNEVVEQKPVDEPKISQAEINWKQANEVMRLQKQRIEELEARHAHQALKPPEEPEIDEFDGLDSDDVITVAKAKMIKESAKKSAAKVAESQAKKIVEEYMQQQKVTSDESRMRNLHDDYDFVMENFAIPMIKNDPALAYKVQNSKNPAEVAYKLAKISDEYEASMKKQETSPRAEKVIKNTSRPTSAAAASTSSKTQVEDFSKMSPHQVWELSQKYARG